jgi:hypothetical protein
VCQSKTCGQLLTFECNFARTSIHLVQRDDILSLSLSYPIVLFCTEGLSIVSHTSWQLSIYFTYLIYFREDNKFLSFNYGISRVAAVHQTPPEPPPLVWHRLFVYQWYIVRRRCAVWRPIPQLSMYVGEPSYVWWQRSDASFEKTGALCRRKQRYGALTVILRKLSIVCYCLQVNKIWLRKIRVKRRSPVSRLANG